MSEVTDIRDEIAERKLKRFHTLLLIANDEPKFVLSLIVKTIAKQAFAAPQLQAYALGMLVGVLFARRFPNMTIATLVASLKAPTPTKSNPFEDDFDITQIGVPVTPKPDGVPDGTA